MHGQGSDRYEHVRIGMNSRLDTIQAAILIEKLKIFEDEIEKRNAVAQRYNDAFAGSNRITAPHVIDGRHLDLGAIHAAGRGPRQIPGRPESGGRADGGLLSDPAVAAEGLCPLSQRAHAGQRALSRPGGQPADASLSGRRHPGPHHRGGAGQRGLKPADLL